MSELPGATCPDEIAGDCGGYNVGLGSIGSRAVGYSTQRRLHPLRHWRGLRFHRSVRGGSHVPRPVVNGCDLLAEKHFEVLIPSGSSAIQKLSLQMVVPTRIPVALSSQRPRDLEFTSVAVHCVLDLVPKVDSFHMALPHFVSLAMSVAELSPQAQVAVKLLEAVAELQAQLKTLDEKLDRLLHEPYQSAVKLTEDAVRASDAAFRLHCLKEARLRFVTAQSLESPAEMRIRATFCAGVCADLMMQPRIALSDYELAFDKCLLQESDVWSFGNMGSKFRSIKESADRAGCSINSRRAMILHTIDTLKNLNAFGKMIRNVLGTNPEPTIEAHYEIMRPIANVLWAKRSRHPRLIKSSELRTDNLVRGGEMIASRTDQFCPKDSKWWTER